MQATQVAGIVLVSENVVLQAVQVPVAWPNPPTNDGTNSAGTDSAEESAKDPVQVADASSKPAEDIALSAKRPFHFCNLCPYTSLYTNSMVRHMRTHTGEKPFKCGVCPRTFTQKHHANAHMRTHTGVAPFGCDECSRRYFSKSKLRDHIIIKHGGRLDNASSALLVSSVKKTSS
ncbi:hypothetical protein HPB50_006845 [Hyalomma asiaticum]|uniref:Uncharacterized protein n=1 Tax=Hyalomma asiaticum TaxID=266040 RepID=A0ACB7RN59_HYAAI|nr:hypothetical protein HPB50_006845 [Hyalomma asiaticum]